MTVTKLRGSTCFPGDKDNRLLRRYQGSFNDLQTVRDTVNTAARMEGVNKYLGTRICVSESAVELCRGEDLVFRPVGSLVLKGKTEGIRAYEIFIPDQHTAEEFDQYNIAFKHLEENSPEAIEWFTQLETSFPHDPLVALHLKRLQQGETGIEIVFAEK
jgi:adenylate cyclase